MGAAPAALSGAGATAGWNFACPDWEQRLAAGRSLMPDLPLDMEAADAAVSLFDQLRLPDVPGEPLLADAAGDWFRDIVRAAFGSIDLATGVRMVSEIFAMVPKKNNKTTGGAAVMLVALLLNQRPRAELLFVAPRQEVSDEAFRQAAGMVLTDREGYLQKRFAIRDHIKTIECRLTKARLRIKTFDMRMMTGAKPVIVLLDELHVMAIMSYAESVLGQVRGGMLPFPESLLIIITTQSDRPPAGVFKTELQYARDVRDGRVTDGRTLPFLYEFPEAIQTDPAKPWTDPKLWHQVNPNLGLSLGLDDLVLDFAKAKAKDEAELRRWASQHLNIEIGLALHSDRWRGADHWEAAGIRSGLSLEDLLARSEVVCCGIDGGGLDDLLGLGVVGRERDTGHWLGWAHAWVQRDVLKLRQEIAPKLEDLARIGELTICDGGTDDIDQLADLVAMVDGADLLPEKYGVGLDPVGVAAIVDALDALGIETDAKGGPVCAVYQGYRLSGAIWGLERKLKDGTFKHGGQQLMAWCVGNAKTEQRGNAVLITKQAAGKAKIDPLVATLNAVALMGRAPVARDAYSFGAEEELV